MSLAEKLFGSFSDRELKKINPLTKQVLALEGKYQAMSDAELQAQTPVQAKITLAVVTMDENARVTSAIGDMTEPELTVSADGTVSAPREPVYTKNELGDRYGMRSASALGKEWYEHSAGWCGYLKGKNAVEIGKLSTDGTDADLKALCTISVTDLQKAALKAMAEQ